MTGCLGLMGFGITIGWSSPSVPYLTSKESEIPISILEGAWITSIINLGTILGLVSLPFLINRLGRKYTILLYGFCQLISFIFIVFANSFATLCIGRVIAGCGTSGSMVAVSIYLGEITEKKIRGMLSSFLVVFSDLGVFIVALFGAYFSYNVINISLLFIPLFHITSFAFMPESPYFYLIQEQDEEAITSLKKLRGVKDLDELETEIKEMKMSIIEINGLEKSNLKDLFFNHSNLKALIILLVVQFASLSSGSVAMLAYSQAIFSYSGFFLSPAHSFIIIIAVKIITGFAVTQIIERFGRRILFFSSGLFCSIFQGVVGLFFFMKFNLNSDVSSISWLPLVSLISFQITGAIGIGPIPYILIAELFSVQIKQIAVPITTIFATIVSFSTEFMFPLINRDVGIYASFWIFAICCFTGSVIFFFITPETKGKSLEEIQLILKSRR